MGMAASQARFLNLTARKSNTEYQGQQVNQARTVLANESANIYNEMANLSVPTPPITTDYSKMGYTLTDINGNSVIIEGWNANPNYTEGSNAPRYIADIQYQERYDVVRTTQAGVSSYQKPDLTLSGLTNSQCKVSNVTQSNKKLDAIVSEYNKNATTPKTAADFVLIQSTNVSGQISTYYAAESDLLAAQANQQDVNLYSVGTNYRDTKGQIYADFSSSSSSGRFSDVTFGNMIDANGVEIPAANNMQGNHGLNITNLYDEDKYEQAYQEYLYEKDVYDKKIEELNAKTAKIQAEDKTLELKLKQLDTEQEALSQEMEAVKAVIQKNVEKTFNTFA